MPAGSVLFYDHNILHRATYPTAPKRGKLVLQGSAFNRVPSLVTLHGCMSSATHAGRERARVILQHDLNWIKTIPLREGSQASDMRDRLVRLASSSDLNELGYSLNG